MDKKGENVQQNKVAGIVLTLLFSITMVMLLVILCVSFFGMHVTTMNRNITELRNDWTVSDGVSAKRTSLPNEITMSRAGSLELSHKLPANLSDGAVMLLMANHQDINVLVGGVPIFRFESTGVLSEYSGKEYQFVPLKFDMAGKMITLQFETAKNIGKTHVYLPVIGSSEAIASYLFRQNFFVILFGSFFALVGVVLFVVGIIFLFKKGNSLSGFLFLSGLFLLCISLWQLLETGILQLLGERESFMYLFSYACHMMMPVPLIWYFAKKLKYRYQILEYLCEFALLNVFVSVVIFISGTADLYQFEVTTPFVVIVSGAFMLYTLMIERLSRGRFMLTLPIVGVFLFTLSGMLDLMLTLTGSDMAGAGSCVGYILTAAVMLVSFGKDFADYIRPQKC